LRYRVVLRHKLRRVGGSRAEVPGRGGPRGGKCSAGAGRSSDSLRPAREWWVESKRAGAQGARAQYRRDGPRDMTDTDAFVRSAEALVCIGMWLTSAARNGFADMSMWRNFTFLSVVPVLITRRHIRCRLTYTFKFAVH